MPRLRVRQFRYPHPENWIIVFVFLLLVILAAMILWGCRATMAQDHSQIPTLEQCRAEANMWDASSKESPLWVSQMTVQTLHEHANEMFKCAFSYSDSPRADFFSQVGLEQLTAIDVRYRRFVERHNLKAEFLKEDANGLR